MDKEIVKRILERNHYKLKTEERKNNCYYQLKFFNGAIVNIFDNGTCQYQGKYQEETKQMLNENNVKSNITKEYNKKVFVVYGHDETAKAQLEALLRKWKLEPLILDQLVSNGNTIIEKLEEYMSQANFGIVLATPDDEGFPSGDEANRRFRVRQNVVLEMGMLLALLKRDKVAILLKNVPNMEKPSDIQGLIYMPFKDKIEEIALGLLREMNQNGYLIEAKNI